MVENGLTASKSCGSPIRAPSLTLEAADAATQEPDNIEKIRHELSARFEVRGREEPAARANAAVQLPTHGL